MNEEKVSSLDSIGNILNLTIFLKRKEKNIEHEFPEIHGLNYKML